MANRVKGGRKPIGGLTLSDEEKALIDRAIKRRESRPSRIEFIREAAVMQARAELGARRAA